MALNSRAKGATGEREVVRKLNDIIERVLDLGGWDADSVDRARQCIQRNQNQSAVGGSDLVGVFGLSIEIKRVEVLQINTWWQQCLTSAARDREWPLLLYRQNNKPWRAITWGYIPLPGNKLSTQFRLTMDDADFETWFYQWVYYQMHLAKK